MVSAHGIEQQISLFGAADVPLDVALVTDASGSMQQQLPAVQDGAQALRGGGLLDGINNSSRVEYDDIISLARALDVTIYTITLEEQTSGWLALYDPPPARWLMRTLSPRDRRTGVLSSPVGRDAANLRHDRAGVG